ncbi:MAG: hypothetical protein J7647_15485 [Cyanobacteria bacterium SBLK]|nr:hypothetical protein [Cyanobacteria bacterium SBLK]
MTLIDKDPPEPPNAIAIDPHLLQEITETRYKLTHLIKRLVFHASPDELVQKTMQQCQKQKDEFIEEICNELGDRGAFEHMDCLQDLKNAKSAFIAHCFCVMFRQGIAWTEIVQEISDRLPPNENNREKIDTLRELGDSLTLTLKDFS